MNLKDFADTAKKALDIANELKHVELKEVILELKKQMMELGEENFAFRKENLALKEQLKEKQEHNMVFDKDKYWNILSDETKDGPYCSACWDADNKAIRMHEDMLFGFVCPVCNLKRNAE